MKNHEEPKAEPTKAMETAREDDGPIHGATPPHGDIFAHQVAASDVAEFDDDAEEQPLVRTSTAS